jgi:hypothetical protein
VPYYNTTLLTILVVSLRIILISLTYGHSNLAIPFFNAIALSPLNNATVAVLKLIWKFPPKNSNHLYKTSPKIRADKSRCSNLLKGNEVVSVILFHDAPYSVRRIKLLHHCEKFLDDPILLSSPYLVQLNVSPGAFTRFMEIVDGSEPHFSQETVDDLLLLAQEFGHNGLIASLVPQRDVPRHEENVHDLLQELNRDLRTTTIEVDLQSIRDSLGVMERRISVMEEKFGEKLERIMSEL